MPKCSGCGKVIKGSSQGLSKHQNRCTAYKAKYSAVPRAAPPRTEPSTSSSSLPTPSYHFPQSGPRKQSRKRRRVSDASEASETLPLEFDSQSEDLGLEQFMDMDIASTGDEDAFLEEELPRERQARPNRGKLPARFVDNALPEGPASLLDNPEPVPDPPAAPRQFLQVGSVRLRLNTTRTAANSFGVERRYFGRPSSVPDAFIPLEDMLNESEAPATAALSEQDEGRSDGPSELSLMDRIAEAIHPYPNFSAWLLGRHHWSTDRKSEADRRALIHDVLLHKLFNAEELRGVNFDTLDDQLSKLDVDDPSLFLGRGWKRSPVRFEVPHGNKTAPPSRDACTFESAGVLHRSIPDLVCEEFAKPAAQAFHFTPFEETWVRGNGQPRERMHGELFSSPAFIAAHEELQSLPPEPGCTLPRAIAGLLVMSDSAHLTDTGNAHIHPFNVAFANESMYSRGKPSNHSVHPVMHLPELSEEDVDPFITSLTGKTYKKGHSIYPHCRREYFHGALKLLFDSEFWDMYAHGRVVKCGDGIERRLYLRLFAYSADYPEKVLIATIRDNGLCPCPRCLTKKEDFDQMGTPADMEMRSTQRRVDDQTRRVKVREARKTFRRGYAVGNKYSEESLKPESYVAVENAFSVTLENGVRLNFFDLLLVDLMHEIELGVWMALLAHLIRILYAIDAEKVKVLNDRYRQVPTFGRDIIRRLSSQVATMTKMTAHEYANMLECAPPCFEGLFGEWDDEIQCLLFTLARWHSLAKLRLHTDSTLAQLRDVTVDFGNAIRTFQVGCCEAFDTRETEAEHQARISKARAAAASNSAGGANAEIDTTRQPRKLNLNTFKFHSMGDYTATIQNFGSTYNYTTAVNELSHRSPIAAYQRTNKRNFESQIVKIDNIKAAHRDIQTRLDSLKLDAVAVPAPARKKRSDEHDGLVGDVEHQFHIAAEERNHISLASLQSKAVQDPVYEDFENRFRDHCMSRMTGETDPTIRYEQSQRDEIRIHGDRIYSHARFRVNYTSYDMRRAQDCINCNSEKCNVMVLSDEDDDGEQAAQPAPFWFARVIGVFHARVSHYFFTEGRERRIEFLWVRWFGRDTTLDSSWASRRLDRLGYIPSSDPDAFGFLDPHLVLRASHIIPAFAHGLTNELLPGSDMRDTVDGDWQYHYANRFPDCDMLQRFSGLGIGHGANRARYPDTSRPVLDARDAHAKSPRSREEPPTHSHNTSHRDDVEEREHAVTGSGGSDDEEGQGADGDNEIEDRKSVV